MASRGLRCVALVALLFVAENVAAQAPAAANPESDTAKAVRYTRALEAAPDSADAMELRQWLTKWTMATPDYMVHVCDVLDLQADVPTPNAGELMMQLMYGNVAWQIEHGSQDDELSKQVAAVESALRVYSAFVAKDARAATPHLDALIAQRDAGTLRADLAPVVARECAGGRDESAP